MSENIGELKKRIRKQFLSNRWSQPSDIFPILDTAKKDYPTIGSMFPDLKAALSDDQITDILIARVKWFEKWFSGV